MLQMANTCKTSLNKVQCKDFLEFKETLYLLQVFVDLLQASAAENADKVESQESPGFFSQIISEFAAPLYEEEEDFLSEENSKDSDTKVGEWTGYQLCVLSNRLFSQWSCSYFYNYRNPSSFFSL